MPFVVSVSNHGPTGNGINYSGLPYAACRRSAAARPRIGGGSVSSGMASSFRFRNHWPGVRADRQRQTTQ